MVLLNKWKEKWELKSLTYEQLFNIIADVIVKQLELEKSDVKLESDFNSDFDADSVDLVGILLYLEDIFKNASATTRTVVPTDQLSQIVIVEDILTIIYDVLLNIENKMETFLEIKPNLAALDKRQTEVNIQ
jgi:acyl carrier protein